MRSRRLRQAGLGSLGRRLAAGSALIALVSVVLLAFLTLLLADFDLSSARHESERSSTKAIVANLQGTYLSDPDWKPKDLASTRDLARSIGVGIDVHADGRQLLRVAPLGRPGGTSTLAVVVHGRPVAQVTVTFPFSGLLPEEVAFRRSIERSVVIASALALAVALGAAVLASRRLVAPVRTLTDATRRLAAGDRSSRVGALRAAGEISELATSFDTMAAALEREDGLRRALVADLAHELRTPVAVMQAQVDGITMGVVALDQGAVDSLAEEVAHLSRLIEDLRILSEADAAGLLIRREPVDLAAVASRAASRLAPFFVERGIGLELQLGAVSVLGDPDRLEQVTVNLLSNAAKFSDAGGTVTASVAAGDGEGRLVVTDHGRGIPPEEAGRVFERFFRGAGTRDTSGSGIGLAVVAVLAAAHGGSVSLSSAPGAGSTFTLHIPLAEKLAIERRLG